MNKQPSISIIVPVYNVEPYLDCCVQSLLNQTIKDVEIILVDDSSPDNCPQMCDEYAQRDQRIKVIHKQNGGLGFARNSGLEKATGRYVTFVDSDDYVEADTYESLITVAEKHQLDILRFGLDRFCHEGVFTEQNHDRTLTIVKERDDIRQLSLQIFSDQLFPYKNSLFSGGSVCTALFRTQILKDNRLVFHSERELVSEDFVYTYECYKYAKRIGNIPYTYYHYRLNPSSLTKKVDTNKMERITSFCEYFTELYLRDGYSRQQALIYPMSYYLGGMRSQAKLVFLSSVPIEEKKKWFLRIANSSYFSTIVKEYPLERMTCFQRLNFRAFLSHRFYLLWGMIRAYEWWKTITRKI